jgi:hypothetical protein
MHALGLSSRTISFTPGVTFNPGDTITFKWLQQTTAGDGNMAQGIDNFKLGDNNSLAAGAPLLASVLLLGSAAWWAWDGLAAAEQLTLPLTKPE